MKSLHGEQRVTSVKTVASASLCYTLSLLGGCTVLTDAKDAVGIGTFAEAPRHMLTNHTIATQD
jgi:hypothetical protein